MHNLQNMSDDEIQGYLDAVYRRGTNEGICLARDEMRKAMERLEEDCDRAGHVFRIPVWEPFRVTKLPDHVMPPPLPRSVELNSLQIRAIRHILVGI